MSDKSKEELAASIEKLKSKKGFRKSSSEWIEAAQIIGDYGDESAISELSEALKTHHSDAEIFSAIMNALTAIQLRRTDSRIADIESGLEGRIDEIRETTTRRIEEIRNTTTNSIIRSVKQLDDGIGNNFDNVQKSIRENLDQGFVEINKILIGVQDGLGEWRSTVVNIRNQLFQLRSMIEEGFSTNRNTPIVINEMRDIVANNSAALRLHNSEFENIQSSINNLQNDLTSLRENIPIPHNPNDVITLPHGSISVIDSQSGKVTPLSNLLAGKTYIFRYFSPRLPLEGATNIVIIPSESLTNAVDTIIFERIQQEWRNKWNERNRNSRRQNGFSMDSSPVIIDFKKELTRRRIPLKRYGYLTVKVDGNVDCFVGIGICSSRIRLITSPIIIIAPFVLAFLIDISLNLFKEMLGDSLTSVYSNAITIGILASFLTMLIFVFNTDRQ